MPKTWSIPASSSTSTMRSTVCIVFFLLGLYYPSPCPSPRGRGDKYHARAIIARGQAVRPWLCTGAPSPIFLSPGAPGDYHTGLPPPDNRDVLESSHPVLR